MQRRDFLTGSLAALAVAGARGEDKTDSGETLLGHGEFRYRIDTRWSQADPAKHPVNDCHEMVQVADGRLFLLTNHKQNNVLIYDTKGKLLEAWTLGLGGAHGLTVNKEVDGREFLYITDTGGRIVKTTLAGEIVMELPLAGKCGAYGERDLYSPTETAIGPDGVIYVADGYGSQWILRFDKSGKFLNKFGGRSAQALNKGKFMQAHGVAIDTRGAQSLVVCSERLRNEFHWYTLEGTYVRSVYLPGAFVSRPVLAGKHLYSGVCFGMLPDDYRMYQNRGFVVVLDEQDRVVSCPGGQTPAYKNERLQLLLQDQPVFKNCHDVCVDGVGDLYVCQWNSGKVYPYKLYRER